MKPQLQFAGTVCTATPSPNYTPGRLKSIHFQTKSFMARLLGLFPLLAKTARAAMREPQPMFKVFRSLPQELEDEAVRDYDRQIDQVVFQSTFLAKLSQLERHDEHYDRHSGSLFSYVFGYAQAKGWTDIEMRFGEADRKQKIVEERWDAEKLREDVKCDDCGVPLQYGEGGVILLGERHHETTGRCCSACYHANHEPK